MISLYPSQPPSGGGKAPAPSQGAIRLYPVAPAPAPAPAASALPPAPAPSMSNLGGVPLLAPSLAPSTAANEGSSLPIAPAAAFDSSVPEKTLARGVSVQPPVAPSHPLPSNLPGVPGIPKGGDGTVIRQATPAEAAAFPSPSPAETIKNAAAAQESLASQADEYNATGKGPVPLKGQEKWAPGQNMYLPGGGTTRVAQGPLEGVLKAAVEFPERLYNGVKDAVSAVQGKGFDTSERVPSFENDAYNAYKAAKNVGYNDNQATLIGMIQGIGSGLIDGTVVAGAFGKGADALIKAAAPDLEQISAWELLDHPTTLDEAKANYRSLSHEFHPDKPGGSAAVQAKLNDAFATLTDKGIPSNVKATLNNLFQKFGSQFSNGEDVIAKARAGNVKEPLGLPAAGETTEPVTASIKPPEPVTPVASENLPPAETAPQASTLPPVQNTPTIDLAPKAPVTAPIDSVIPPVVPRTMTQAVIEKLSAPKPGIPVTDVAKPVSQISTLPPSSAPVAEPIKTTSPTKTQSVSQVSTKAPQAVSEPSAVAKIQARSAAAAETKLPSETKPFTPQEGTSKIGKSIEQKAIDAGHEAFPQTAKFETINVKDQAQKAGDLIKSDLQGTRAIIRGERALPEGVKGQAIINAMEEHLKLHPSADLAYELANSPLVTAGSEAAQEMRLMAEREPDSAMAKIQEIKNAMVKKAGGSEKIAKAKAQIVKQLKVETEKVNLSKEDLSWNKFLSTIEC